MAPIVIVGASLAGTQAAQAIRRAGFEGGLVMVGDEPHYPYDRPPLSKNYLTDEVVDEDRLRLRPVVDPAALEIDWRLGRRADRLDVGSATITLDDGETLGYDGLVIATGARPRRLTGSGEPPAGMFELRSLDDARALRRALAGVERRVVVCGAGFIGSEVAASARAMGLPVTLVDAAPAPLARVLDTDAGMAVAELHRSHDVDIRLGVGVEHPLVAADGSVAGLRLTDGSEVEADVVVVGIGVVPNTDWLDGSGLTVDDGIVVDETCLAAPGVVAAGDVARWPNRRFGGRLMRVEQWDNAVEMGIYAGKRVLTQLPDPAQTAAAEPSPQPFQPVPWFWSDQYDRKIQLAGVVTEDHEVVQGSVEEARFVQLYSADGMLQGAFCWNRPRQAIQARQLVADGASMDEARERLGP